MKLNKAIGAIALTASLLATTAMPVFAYDPSLNVPPATNPGNGGRPGIEVGDPNGNGSQGKGVYGAHYDEEGNLVTEEQAQQGAANGLSARYTQGGKLVKEAAIGRQVQGDLGALAFRNATPVGWNEAFAFNITLRYRFEFLLRNKQPQPRRVCI